MLAGYIVVSSWLLARVARRAQIKCSIRMWVLVFNLKNLKLCKALSVCRNLSLNSLSLFTLALTHKHTDFLGKLIS